MCVLPKPSAKIPARRRYFGTSRRIPETEYQALFHLGWLLFLSFEDNFRG